MLPVEYARVWGLSAPYECVCRWRWFSPRCGNSLLDLTAAGCSGAVLLWCSFCCVSIVLRWRGVPPRGMLRSLLVVSDSHANGASFDALVNVYSPSRTSFPALLAILLITGARGLPRRLGFSCMCAAGVPCPCVCVWCLSGTGCGVL